MPLFIFLLIFPQSETAPLSETLLLQLESGKPTFSIAEMALIAGGAETQADLEKYQEELSQVLASLALNEKQQGQAPEKQWKALVKSLSKSTKNLVPEATLQDTIQGNAHNGLTASLLLHLTGETSSLAATPWPKNVKPAESYFGNLGDKRGASIVAALFLQTSDRRVTENSAQAVHHLKVSKLLSPDGVFEADRLSREWYNRIHKFYNDRLLLSGGELALAAAERFPQLKEFQPLCFNFGILLSQDSEIPLERKLPLIEGLAAHTGEHRASLEETAAAMKFNQAIAYFEAGEANEAWALVKTIQKAPQGSDLESLKITILEGLIEKQLADGASAESSLEELKTLAPSRYDALRTRLKQLAVKASYDSGNFEAALALAEKQIDSPQGRNNYLAVLQKLISQRQSQHAYEAALKKLNSISPNLVDQDALANLKYNTYVAWLEHKQEPEAQFPIYRSLLGDKSLNLKENEREALKDGWGNAYYLLIEQQIADRNFEKAEELSKQALTTMPNHANLLKQKALIETIMARIK